MKSSAILLVLVKSCWIGGFHVKSTWNLPYFTISYDIASPSCVESEVFRLSDLKLSGMNSARVDIKSGRFHESTEFHEIWQISCLKSEPKSILCKKMRFRSLTKYRSFVYTYERPNIGTRPPPHDMTDKGIYAPTHNIFWTWTFLVKSFDWVYSSKFATSHKYRVTFLGKWSFVVYREGDIVKQPMKKGPFVPKNVPRVGCLCPKMYQGWGGVGHVGVGWGGS